MPNIRNTYRVGSIDISDSVLEPCGCFDILGLALGYFPPLVGLINSIFFSVSRRTTINEKNFISKTTSESMASEPQTPRQQSGRATFTPSINRSVLRSHPALLPFRVYFSIALDTRKGLDFVLLRYQTDQTWIWTLDISLEHYSLSSIGLANSYITRSVRHWPQRVSSEDASKRYSTHLIRTLWSITIQYS